MRECTSLYVMDRGLEKIVPHQAFDAFKLHVRIAYL